MIGLRLAHYQILAELGRGGMGVVYRALDLHLEREVAVKVLGDKLLTDEVARRRFQREARALSRLGHPNVAGVFSFEQVTLADGPVDMLVMELCPGTSLDELLTRGPLPVDQAVNIAAQVAAGLAAAHERGVLHRDVKPANIHVLPNGTVKLLDFGVARLLPTEQATGLGGRLSGDESRGQTVVGTAAYLAPETIASGAFDARSDVYALGLVLFEVLAGRPPFTAADLPGLVRAIVNQSPPPLASLRPTTPRWLAELVDRCLSKAPESRPQSAEEVGRLLAAGGGAATGAASATDRRGRWRALAVAVAIMAVGSGVLWWRSLGWPKVELQPTDWVVLAGFEDEAEEPQQAAALHVVLATGLAEDPDVHLLGQRRLAAALERMGKPRNAPIDAVVGREICRREGARVLLVPTLVRVGERYLLGVRVELPGSDMVVAALRETADSRDELLDAANRLVRGLARDLGQAPSDNSGERELEPLPPVSTPILAALERYADGKAFWREQRHAEAVAAWAEALQLDPQFAMAHAELGAAYAGPAFNQPDRARSHFAAALAAGSRLGSRERLRLSALSAHALGHQERATELYALYLRAYPADDETRFDRAHLLMTMGHLREAISELATLRELGPREDPSVLINLATSHVLLGEAERALPFYQLAFKLEPSWLGRGALNHEYGFALVVVGEVERAREAFTLALADSATAGRAERDLGLLELLFGRPRSAAAHFERAIALDEQRQQRLSVARHRLFLAAARRALGDDQGARQELGAALLGEPVDAPVWLVARIGVELARLGSLDQAAVALERSRLRLDPADSSALGAVNRLAAELALASGRPGEAWDFAQLLGSAEARPERLLALSTLARAAERVGEVAKAQSAWEELQAARSTALGWEAQLGWIESHFGVARLALAAGDRAAAAAALAPLNVLWASGEPEALATLERALPEPVG